MSERLSEIRDWAERMMKVPPGHYDSEHQLASDCLYMLERLEEAQKVIRYFVDWVGEEPHPWDAAHDYCLKHGLLQPAVALDAADSQYLTECDMGLHDNE